MDANATQIQTRYPTRPTHDTLNQLSRLPLRDCHPLWPVVPDRSTCLLSCKGSNPHAHRFAPANSVCALPLSIAFTNGIPLVSFPAGTKMLQFPAFPLLSEQLGDFRFKGRMRLPGTFRSLPRPSSALKPRHPPYRVAPNYRLLQHNIIGLD